MGDNLEPGRYLVQWMDGAGIHEARLANDLNGATTLCIALKHTGGATDIGLFEEGIGGRVQRIQRF